MPMLSNIRKKYIESLSGLSKEVWIISILMLINRSGLMVIPFLAIYLTEELGYSLIQAGTVGMWFGVGSMISAIFGGQLTDRFGYHNVMKFSLIAGGLAFWGLSLVSSFYPMCIMIFATSVLADLLRPAVMSSITLYSSEENRTRAISLLRMAINLGIAIGPSIGGLLVAYAGYSWLFIVNGATSIITFFIFIYVLRFMVKRTRASIKETKKHSTQVKSAYLDLPYLYLLFITLLMAVAFIQIIFSIPLFFKEVYTMTEQQVGFFFTINGLLIVLLELPIVSYFESRRLFKRPIVIGGVLMVVSFLSLLLPSDGALWIIPFLLYTFTMSVGEIFNLPFINSLSLARASESNTGSYMGLFAFNFSLSFTLAPIMGSRIIEAYGYTTLWIFCAVLVALSVFLFLVSQKLFLISEQYQ